MLEGRHEAELLTGGYCTGNVARGFDLDKAMDQHPEYADLVADLEWIDTHVATLPVLHAPDTDPQWLKNIIETPQIPRLPNALEPHHRKPEELRIKGFGYLLCGHRRSPTLYAVT